jgi:hypothetical protein
MKTDSTETFPGVAPTREEHEKLLSMIRKWSSADFVGAYTASDRLNAIRNAIRRFDKRTSEPKETLPSGFDESVRKQSVEYAKRTLDAREHNRNGSVKTMLARAWFDGYRAHQRVSEETTPQGSTADEDVEFLSACLNYINKLRDMSEEDYYELRVLNALSDTIFVRLEQAKTNARRLTLTTVAKDE